MSDFDQQSYLDEMLKWVVEHSEEEGVAEFLKSLAKNGKTLYEIAAEDPQTGLALAECLFEMCEELYDDSEGYRELFKITQPKPKPDERWVLPS